jgi:predicted permease
VPVQTVVGLLTSKLLLHPLLGLAGVLAALQGGLLPRDTDPLMLLVMLLVWATPTAVLTHSLATMLQVCFACV